MDPFVLNYLIFVKLTRREIVFKEEVIAVDATKS